MQLLQKKMDNLEKEAKKKNKPYIPRYRRERQKSYAGPNRASTELSNAFLPKQQSKPLRQKFNRLQLD